MILKFKFSWHLLVFLVFLSPICLGQAANDTNLTEESTTPQIPLALNERIYDKINTTQKYPNTKYYIINVTESLDDADIIVIAKPGNRLSDPDIFISSKNPYPNSYETSEKVCNSFGLDVCVINASMITATKVFYVGISCFQDCEYFLLAEYNTEVFLTLGQEVFIRFYDEASEIAKIYVPKDDSIDQLIIYANLLNSQQINQTFYMYVNEGNKIPSSSEFDFYSTEVWYDGKGVSISRESKYENVKSLLTDCNYTVTIEAPANSIVVLVAEVFPKVRPLQLFKEVHDLVGYQENQTYVLKLSDEELNDMKEDPLIIELRVFSGDPDLYVHFDTLPDHLENYQWVSNESGNEALSISSYERKSVGASGKVFYITVFGKFESGYIIDAYYTKKNEDFLLFGETFTGSVITGEVMNYRLNLFGSGEATIVLELNSETGNADLYAKRCSTLDKGDCKITKNDLENNNSNLWKSNNAYGLDNVYFFFNHTDCNIQVQTQEYGLINICTYQIGVYGNSSNSNISHYSLLAKHSQHHVILKEDEGFRNQLEMNEITYYKFFVSNDSTIQEVDFVADCVAGEVTIYSSKTNRYPNSSDHEKASYFELDYINYQQENDGELSGMIYLTVIANSLADYIITPIVKRVDGNLNQSNNTLIKYTRLRDGQPVKRSFQDRQTRTYFKVKVTFNETSEIDSRTVLLNFKPISGNFKIYVSKNDVDPSETAYDFELYDNELLFENIDVTTIRFRVLVVVDTNSSIQNFYKFEIFYATSESIIHLTYHPYYDTLSEDQMKYFVINYDPSGPDLVITKTAYTGLGKQALDMWVSLDRENPYPDERFFDFNSTDKMDFNSSSLTIQKEDLVKACDHKPCPMFISLYAYQDLLFSLVVRQKVVPLLLYDGIISKIPIPNLNQSLNFYYFVPNNATVTVFVDSFYVALKAFVNIMYLENDDKSKWNYPSEFDFEYSYNTSYYSPGSIILYKSEFEKCSKNTYGCVLLLSISVNENLYSQQDIIQDFEILVTSEITRLKEGNPMIGYVEKHMIKYYSFKIHKSDCTILISVTPTGDGDPDLVVSKGKESRPTLENYQWISNTYKGDVLQINKKDNESMKGTYVVGVYGFTNTTFSISFISEKDTISLIRSGYPTEINLKEGDYQHLQFYNTYGDFRVILNKNFGSGKVYINSYNSSFDFIGQIPNRTNYQWSTLNNNRDIIYIEESDVGYCTFCQYIIAIYAEKDSKLQLTISNEVDPIHLQSGQPLNDYVDKGCQTHYYYQTNQESAEMNILLYAGEIEVYISNNDTVSESNYYKKLTKKDFIANELDVSLGKGFSLIPYFDEANSTENNIYRHSVLVKGILETNFSITFLNVHEKKVLRYGVADYASLDVKESQEYLFYGENDQVFSLLLTVGNQAGITDIDSSFNSSYLLPEVSIKYQEKTGGKLQIANIVKSLTTFSSYFYQISTVKGTYYINVSNPNAEEIHYNLLVNSNDVELIIPGTETMQSIGEGKKQYYELYSPEPKKVFIEIFECLGKVDLKGTQNYLKMKNGNFDWEFEYPYENNHIIAFYEVEAGPVFIGVEAIEGFTPNETDSSIPKEALYVMKTHLLPPKGKIPQEKFFAGGDGALLYKNGFLNNHINVEFKPVDCATKNLSESFFVPIQYVYYLHISSDQTILTSFSRCNMNDDAFAIFQLSESAGAQLYYQRYVQVLTGADNQSKIIFDLDLPEEKEGPFFINAVAEVWVYDNINNVFEQFTIVYNPQEIYKQQKGKPTEEGGVKMLWILLIAGGALILVTLICCCYYMKRTKKFEKRLKYELSDIRNVAGGEIFEDKKPSDKPGEMPIHYKGFLEEKGPEEN